MTETKKERCCKLSCCIINIAKLQSDCKNRGVFEDFDFVTLVAFAYHLSSRNHKKTFRNWCPRRPKTSPKRSSMSYASWKRFWDGFGTILDSHMAPQKRSSGRPRGIKKRILFSLASQEASRMDFGPHLDSLGLDFEHYLEVSLA